MNDSLHTQPAASSALALTTPSDAGFDPVKLANALDFAASCETRWPRDLGSGLRADPKFHEPPPWNTVLGPTRDRSGPNGVVLRGGAIVASYGDSLAVDMSFSIAKSYLAVLTGIAIRDGLIADLDSPVRNSSLDDGFESAQNQTITWRHLLHQSSEWEGTLWSKPDLVDRNRQVGKTADNSHKGSHRDLQTPGTVYEYNDVRVNRLSLSLMQVFGRELGEVLKAEVMDPIGASNSWTWHPYSNSAFDINGKTLYSVPGGSHWGGGIFMHSEDHARFGQLIANDGCWDGQRLLPEGWVELLTSPSPCNAGYGALWWLNRGNELYANGPTTSFFAIGAGANIIWVDQALDLVMVMRWIDSASADQLVGKVMDALVKT